MALLLRGAPVAAALSEDAAARASLLAARGVVPTLAIVRVGERPDDLSYERGALKRCERVGVAVRRLVFPDDVGQEVLLDAIRSVKLLSTFIADAVIAATGAPVLEEEMLAQAGEAEAAAEAPAAE